MQTTSAKILFAGIWQDAPQDLDITAVITDSREVVSGCAFLAIKGERVDGHNFAKQVFSQGAAVVLAQHTIDGVPQGRTIIIEDPLQTMIKIGANYRKQYSPIVLGVTGSVGKTTTKEFCAAVFSAFGNTVKNEGNQNNEIGLPKTLMRIDDETCYVVVEMGMQGFGQIHDLTMAALPDAGIITNIGMAHLEQMGTKENTLKAKMEIADGVPYGGPVILNGDDELLLGAVFKDDINPVYVGIYNENCGVLATEIVQSETGQSFKICDKHFGEFPAFIPVFGQHNIIDALLAFAAATRLGLDAANAAKALSSYKPSGMRQNVKIAGGVTIIEDCYNASPDSMRASLKMLKDYPNAKRRIAVLGDMLELGDIAQEAHKEVGALCAKLKLDEVVTVGTLAQEIASTASVNGVKTQSFANKDLAAEYLVKNATQQDVILFKASNGMHFEDIIVKVMESLLQG